RLEGRVALLLCEREASLGVAALGGDVADDEGDGGTRKACRLAFGEPLREQHLNQAPSALARLRSDVLDQPVVIAALNPAWPRIGSAGEDRRNIGVAHARLPR